MCGIAGYLGSRDALKIVLDGLESIEYRGYDSSGLVLNTKTGFQTIKTRGSLDRLKEKISSISISKSRAGLGHTRWATHGEPSETNAHPFCTGKFHVVHNGMVENYKELKKEFNLQLKSQTDTEVIACLLDHFFSKTKELLTAVMQVNSLLKGSYTYVFLHEDFKDLIMGSRRGPPLIVGKGENSDFFISSDLPSLARSEPQVFILENNEIFRIQKNECRFFSFNGKPIDKKAQNIKWNQSLKSKKGFPYFMLKEIFEQPSSIMAVLNAGMDFKTGTVGFASKKLFQMIKKKRRLAITACGSSYYAALYAKFMIESLARIPVSTALASEFQYQNPILKKDDPVLFISQSGETADTLSSLKTAREKKAFCASLCNVKNSSLDRESDECFYIHAGLEIGVASTKTFTSSLTVLLLLALALAEDHPKIKTMTASLKTLPSYMEDILAKKDFFEDLAPALKNYKGFLYLGRGPHYPIALEGALKMKELAYIHAEGCPSGEMKHGPLALVDDHFLTIGLNPKDSYYYKNLMNFEEIRARKGQLLAIGFPEDSALKNMSQHYFSLPRCPGFLTPLLETTALQLLAYYFSIFLGHNVDRPRNLAKSVTVE